jgi:hypothetical protein
MITHKEYDINNYLYSKNRQGVWAGWVEEIEKGSGCGMAIRIAARATPRTAFFSVDPWRPKRRAKADPRYLKQVANISTGADGSINSETGAV